MANFVLTDTNGEPIAETCPATGFQSLSVCAPVTVTPFAKSGVTKTKCCGDPVVRPGQETCPGIKNGSCHFTKCAGGSNISTENCYQKTHGHRN